MRVYTLSLRRQDVLGRGHRLQVLQRTGGTDDFRRDYDLRGTITVHIVARWLKTMHIMRLTMDTRRKIALLVMTTLQATV